MGAAVDLNLPDVIGPIGRKPDLSQEPSQVMGVSPDFSEGEDGTVNPCPGNAIGAGRKPEPSGAVQMPDKLAMRG